MFTVSHMFEVLVVYMGRTLSDGLLILDPFIRFVVCDPSSTPAFQQLRSSLISTLCLKCIDNLPLIQYLLRLIPLMPVVHICCCENIHFTYNTYSHTLLLLLLSYAFTSHIAHTHIPFWYRPTRVFLEKGPFNG